MNLAYFPFVSCFEQRVSAEASCKPSTPIREYIPDALSPAAQPQCMLPVPEVEVGDGGD